MSEGPATSQSDSGLPNVPEFTVSEISGALKRTVEGEFGHIRVRGEISGFKRAASGHLYMALKDENAVIDGVCWRGTAGRLSVEPEDGLEVIATGRITTYPQRSKYQIVIESLELAGEGALLKLLEERRRKLAAEGLFDLDRKQDIPYLPSVIGVVTSPTGAVIRDILHRLADRFPRHVLLWPVLVQGDSAAEQVAAAIEGFNRLDPAGDVPRPDVLIVARGGGSLEDLWAFNEEIVVRAAAASAIPIISAVGHETDTTLIDHAADRRAPTPSAAAEMAVPVRSELATDILDRERRLIGAMQRYLDARRVQVDGAGRGLPDPKSVLESKTQQLDDRTERLGNAAHALARNHAQELGHMATRLHVRYLREPLRQGQQRLEDFFQRLRPAVDRAVETRSDRLATFTQLLDSYSYQRVLERGFALVRDSDGQPVTSVAGAAPGLHVGIRFHDGEAAARIEGSDAAPKKPRTAGGKARRSRGTRKTGGDQGQLL